jgi:hypothetical protein
MGRACRPLTGLPFVLQWGAMNTNSLSDRWQQRRQKHHHHEHRPPDSGG